MKRTFASIILCLSILTLAAQPRSGFKQLLSYGNTPINVNSIIRMLTINPANGISYEDAQRYGHEQMLDDMRAIFLPYYRPVLSHDDINFILAIYHSPEVNNALRHLEILNDNALSQEQFTYLSPAFNAILAGEKPEPVKLKEGISQDYMNACSTYFLELGQAEILAQLKNNMAQNIDGDGAKNLNKLIDYVISSTPTINANIIYGKVSIEELKLITGLYQTKAFQHFKAGNIALSSQSHIVMPKIIEAAKQWKAKKEE